MRAPTRWTAVALASVAVGTLSLIGTPTVASPASTDGVGAPAYSQTKHLDRTIMIREQGELVPVEIDSRDVTVTVDRTTQLRGRERINIAWSGAHPTGGRSSSPFGEQGLAQEYPVVILQCRGVDDPSLPPAQQLSPQTCWTSSRMQRSQALDESKAVWRHDAHGDEAFRAQKSGLSPIPEACQDPPNFSTHLTPFVAANGTVHPACTSETMPPEAAVGAAFPPAEMAAFSDLDGNGQVKFEVRSAVENESLGCSDKVACSIVVIPIQGISCAVDNPECSKAGRFESGSSNFANEGVDMTVSPLLWWSPSNWRNRFSVPIEFGLPPDACSILDDRAPTGFYGSELMSQAALQWSPAYCLNKDRFKFQHNRMADAAGFTLAESGGGVAAFVSGKHEAKGSDPMAYAPTAVTGFSIGYVIDRPQNSGAFTDLRLNARLIAKLMTQSYLGSELGRAHPGMATNPVSLNLDPEFQALNPGLDSISREAAATLLSLSEASDVITALTDYIANDKDASAFVNGQVDPWGMRVNPNYRKIKLPTDEWPLLDDFVPVTNDECRQQNPTPYFTQLAAPVPSLRKIAEAVLDSWPNVQTKCERALVTDPWKIGRADRQGVGTRFMLGVVSVGDARRLGLDEARLHTRGQEYVAPTEAAMSRAVSLAEPAKNGTDPFTLDMAKVVKAGDAYPGTMIVYTAARTANLPKQDAAKVAQFIEVSMTEGQRPGFGNGELPLGFVPIAKTGPTAPLRKQALAVAKMIGDQTGVVAGEEGEDEGSSTGDGSTDTGSTEPPSGPQGGPGDITPMTEPMEGPGTEGAGAKTPKPEKPGKAEPVAMPPTQAVSSPVAANAIPVLLAVAVVAMFVGALLRVSMRLKART